MVVPGIMEALSPKSKRQKRKHEWSSPLEYIVEKMGSENLRITQVRLCVALCWIIATGLTMYTSISLSRLRFVLMFHHFLAAAGLDEALLMSFSAAQPFALRILRPGSVVTPWFRGLLPQRQTIFGAGLYAIFLGVSMYQLSLYRVGNDDVSIFVVLFLMACGLERGLFHSTRPSDILKFLIATLLPQPELAVYTLLGCLYFWSGMYKLRGFFHGFVFQYQFLNLSGVSWLFRRLYLSESHLPRQFGRLFGALGTWAEMAIGFAMLVVPLNQISAICLMLGALGMHAFIFFFGMGPFRWNVMTAYMMVASTQLCIASGVSGPSLIYASWYVVGYVFVFGLLIPVVGTLDPQTLGQYFGGYRMATFHFAGNETYRALLVRKNAIPSSSEDSSCLGNLLRERVEGYNAITDDEDMFTALCYTDGTDVESALKRGFQGPSGMTDFDEFNESFMFVPITWLNMRGPLLNTKWDESLPVTDRFVELVCETVAGANTENARLPQGCILEFVAHVVPWMGGKTKRLELFDLTSSKWSQTRWEEEIELPWLPQQLAKMAPGSGASARLL